MTAAAPGDNTTRHVRQSKDALQLAVSVVELYATVEILWGFLKPGEPRLYQMVWDQVVTMRERAFRRRVYQLQITETLRFIRRLPEHDA